MSDRFYVNDVQIFGNNEMFPKTYDELEKQGAEWDDGTFDEIEITDPQALMDAVEQDTFEYLKKVTTENLFDKKTLKSYNRDFKDVHDKELILNEELRRLRKKVKTLEEDLSRINRRYNALLSKAKQELPVSTMSVMIPNLYTMEGVLGYRGMDSKPISEYVTKRMTDKMKIKLVDDLFNQGFIRKVRDDEYGEVYEVKLVRSEE